MGSQFVLHDDELAVNGTSRHHTSVFEVEQPPVGQKAAKQGLQRVQRPTGDVFDEEDKVVLDVVVRSAHYQASHGLASSPVTLAVLSWMRKWS